MFLKVVKLKSNDNKHLVIEQLSKMELTHTKYIIILDLYQCYQE